MLYRHEYDTVQRNRQKTNGMFSFSHDSSQWCRETGTEAARPSSFPIPLSGERAVVVVVVVVVISPWEISARSYLSSSSSRFAVVHRSVRPETRAVQVVSVSNEIYNGKSCPSQCPPDEEGVMTRLLFSC